MEGGWFFSKNGAEAIGHRHKPYNGCKNQPQWIRKLNVKRKTIKLLRKSLGSRGRHRILTLDRKRTRH